MAGLNSDSLFFNPTRTPRAVEGVGWHQANTDGLVGARDLGAVEDRSTQNKRGRCLPTTFNYPDRSTSDRILPTSTSRACNSPCYQREQFGRRWGGWRRS